MYPRFACGENAPKRADTMPKPRAAMCPEPRRSSSLPVGKRTSPRIAKVVRSVWVRLTLTRAAMSPMPVADPSTNREVDSCGLAGVPPKKCCAVVPPKGKICASLVPRSDVETIGSTTFEAERGAAAGRAHREVRDVLADCRSDERDQGAVVGHGRGDEVVGVQRGRGVGAGRAAEEQRVLAVRENEQLGDLVPQTL